MAGLIGVTMMPQADFAFTPAGKGIIVGPGGSRMDVTAPVTIANPRLGVEFRMAAGQLTDYAEPRGTWRERHAFYAGRDRLASLLSQPGTVLTLPDGTSHAAGGRSPSPVPPVPVVVVILSALVAALSGIWLFVIRPGEEAARAFALSGACFLVNTIVMAAVMMASPALPGQWYKGLLLVNFLFAGGIALGLVDLFGRYPLPLVPRRWLNLLWIMLPSAILAFWLADIDYISFWYELALGAIVTLLVGLVFLQLHRNRNRPDIMAAFRWIGSTLLLSIICAFSLTVFPILAGLPTANMAAIAIPVFALFFLALGLAVTRYRLMDLGNWSIQIVRTTAVLAVVLILDFALAAAVGTTWTLSVALLLTALIWIPLRELVLRRTERARGVENIALLRNANRIVFARNADEQDAAWRAFLLSQFDPLTVTQAPSGAMVAVDDSGQTLDVPSPLGQGGLRLSFPARGTRLFARGDLAIAEAMVSLVREMVAARDAYDRGREAERMRIARDLHDDVGARLLTSLYQVDIATMQTDVRQAMGEMRMIIDDLSGRQRPLQDLLADLRHETGNRLELAGIDLDWPLVALPSEPMPIDHRANRALHAVMRELVSNIIRHAEARHVAVGVTVADGVLRLRVQDDGAGIAFDAVPDKGNGFANMRRRLAEISGDLSNESIAQGSCFVAMIPLR
jgi:signal transduction histidine kinase